METDARASGAYVPTMRKRRARPRPLALPRRRAHQKPAPAGVAWGFRPEARGSPFGSGSSPSPWRGHSRSLNIRDQRLSPARISGDGRERKDPVTPLPVSSAAWASALGAAAPSGAESRAARIGARAFLSEPSRENAAPFFPSPALGKEETRDSALPSPPRGTQGEDSRL